MSLAPSKGLLQSLTRQTYRYRSSSLLRRNIIHSPQDSKFFELRGLDRPPPNFVFFPQIFNEDEQTVLLSAALKKLDSVGSRRSRRKRKTQGSGLPSTSMQGHSPRCSSLFLPDALYEFEEGHFDGVITNYREAHVSSWMPEDVPLIQPLLNRLKGVIPEVETQTHILHLGSEGEILPHIDNVHASGSWILGISLGSERVMRMQSMSASDKSFDVLLPSGSVYMQSGDTRYTYKHSILKLGHFRGKEVETRQRLSIMIRDRLGHHPLPE